MDENIKGIITLLKERISEAIPNVLKKIIVFGSRARGDALDDSDLDVVVLISERNCDIEQRLDDIAYSVMWDHDFRPVISLKVFSESQFTDALSKGFPFYRNVMREGVVV